MSNKTIAKYSCFVILIAAVCLLDIACGFASPNPAPRDANSAYGPPVVTGLIKSADITESSGLAASRCQEGVFWTHNDSGDDAFIYALNQAGDSLGTWKIPNATNIDWEDIAGYKDASGRCYLLIGEIGDNRSKRQQHGVYSVAEPVVVPEAAASDRKNPMRSAEAESLIFRYPDGDHDAETLMVHPTSGDIYIATKRLNGPSAVYRIKSVFNSGDILQAEKVAELSMPAVPNGLLTGGSISPDARRVVLCDYGRAYELVLPANTQEFEEIWKQAPQPIDIGKRKNGEAVSYSADGTSIFATSEKRGSPVIEVKRRDR